MVFIIKRWERRIIINKSNVIPGIKQKKLNKFIIKVSNPKDITDYFNY